ncbi:MAG: hypothetical protein JNJ71_09650 [Rubrivivax sp.]|nr:hypothetical protein [Rubrivivax sp.]
MNPQFNELNRRWSIKSAARKLLVLIGLAGLAGTAAGPGQAVAASLVDTERAALEARVEMVRADLLASDSGDAQAPSADQWLNWPNWANWNNWNNWKNWNNWVNWLNR